MKSLICSYLCNNADGTGQLRLKDQESKIISVAYADISSEKTNLAFSTVFESLLKFIFQLFKSNYNRDPNSLRSIVIDPSINSITFKTEKFKHSLFLTNEEDIKKIEKYIPMIAEFQGQRIK